MNLRASKIFTPSIISSFRNFKLGLFGLCLLTGYSGASLAADTFKGAELYAAHCVSCHGVSGINIMPDAPDFTQYESLLQPDLTLLTSIKNGKNAMPAYQGVLTDQDIMDVIVYLRTLN